ncbi:tyrosine-type recombinase/integrase [Roseibium sp.]|uniref:tyrosine-type recombinase/integrase n=1 Tax=Roseibium sp. TaxID=1936156 RepID=UPI003B517463
MRKFNEENERIKRQYLIYLREAKGQDESSLDKVAAALLYFEEALSFKPFKAFNRDWATTFKNHLRKRKNARSGKPLGITTRDSILRLVRNFVEWLSGQQGYKSRITYSDAAYFNNNAKEARAAHAVRPIDYPSLIQCEHAFRNMPEVTLLDRRDKAIFAFLMLTAARDSAAASLKLAHIDLVEGKVLQDGREVRTKNSKTFETWFFPVDPMYRVCFESWVNHLRKESLYGPGDALFPKVEIKAENGRFNATGLSREPYSNGQKINQIFKGAFENAGLQAFSAHTVRKTLGMYMNEVCRTPEQFKAWSQNLGHEHLGTTISAYMPISRERQREIIAGLAKG